MSARREWRLIYEILSARRIADLTPPTIAEVGAGVDLVNDESDPQPEG